jgi:transcriptional regulator with XRE-family HTH domain
MKRLNSEVLESRLAELGLSQSAISERIGCSREAVSQWMLGKSFPRPKALLELSSITGLPFGRLVIPEAKVSTNYAFRTNRNVKPNAELRERAEDMTAGLLLVRPYFVFDTSFALPILAEPRNEYPYVQTVAKELRDAIGCPREAPAEERKIIGYFDRLRTIFVPVLWGSSGPNAFHVGFDNNAVNFVYLNLQKRISDVKYWMIHELGHILTPSLSDARAEEFAESLAGAFLFPEPAAAALYKRIVCAPTPAAIVLLVIEAASIYGISPITVWKEIGRYASFASERIPELDMYGAAANYDKTVKTLAEILFEEDQPSVEKYVTDTRSWFGSRFFDGLGRYLREKKKGPSIVQQVLGISMSDAKGVRDYLVHG